MNDDERRRRLREFLMERRARLKPEDVALPRYGKRRCPGLRREEVAELAGVSATWYTLFEIARSTRRPSIRMVERVADALRLSQADRLELLRLAIPEVARASKSLESERASLARAMIDPIRRLGHRLAVVDRDVDAHRVYAEELQRALPGIRDVAIVHAIRDTQAAAALAGGQTIVLSDGAACCAVLAGTTVTAYALVRASASRYFATQELFLIEALTALLGAYRTTHAPFKRTTPMRLRRPALFL